MPRVADQDAVDQAENLSVDDDLLSWLLLDQIGIIGQSPGGGRRLGVHPQQVKYVGPPVRQEDILAILHETIVRNGKLDAAVMAFMKFPPIQQHMASKQTPRSQRFFQKHLVRYLQLYTPKSRVEIHTTNRYDAVSNHTQLAVYATRNIPKESTLLELQGPSVYLPESWRKEMDVSSEEENASGLLTDSQRAKLVQRRSGRMKRRDFSILYSTREDSYKLFLGPARFMNHDCKPNCELSPSGEYVTFKVLRDIRIGEELTTDYGPRYFDKDNAECMCATCEREGKGYYAKRAEEAAAAAEAARAAEANDDLDAPTPAPTDLLTPTDPPTPGTEGVVTPRKNRHLSNSLPGSPAWEPGASESENEPSPSKSRPVREARLNSKPLLWKWPYSERRRNIAPVGQRIEPRDDSERCITCCTAIEANIWAQMRQYKHCDRCIRHALIFRLPWPAHNPHDVSDWPPSHLLPTWMTLPPKISSVPLPTLKPPPKKTADEIEEAVLRRRDEIAEAHAPADTNLHRAFRRFRQQVATQEFVFDSLTSAAWEADDRRQQAERTRREAREADRREREARRKRQNENKIRGSGLWQRYEMVSEEEVQKRMEAKHQVVSGTRRGGRFRASSDDEEMRKLAEQRVREELERERRSKAKAQAYRLKDKKRRLARASGVAYISDEDELEVVDEGDEGDREDEDDAGPSGYNGVHEDVFHEFHEDGVPSSDEDVAAAMDALVRTPVGRPTVAPKSSAKSKRAQNTPTTAPRTQPIVQNAPRPEPAVVVDEIDLTLALDSTDEEQPYLPSPERRLYWNTALKKGATPGRKRGRPPGTGHVQRREQKRRAREERALRKALERDEDARQSIGGRPVIGTTLRVPMRGDADDTDMSVQTVPSVVSIHSDSDDLIPETVNRVAERKLWIRLPRPDAGRPVLAPPSESIPASVDEASPPSPPSPQVIQVISSDSESEDLETLLTSPARFLNTRPVRNGKRKLDSDSASEHGNSLKRRSFFQGRSPWKGPTGIAVDKPAVPKPDDPLRVSTTQ